MAGSEWAVAGTDVYDRSGIYNKCYNKLHNECRASHCHYNELYNKYHCLFGLAGD